jgi:hypothetical protein
MKYFIYDMKAVIKLWASSFSAVTLPGFYDLVNVIW